MAERTPDDRIAAANPVPFDDVAGWAGSPEGADIYEQVLVSATTPGTAELERPRRRGRSGRLAVAAAVIAAFVALGVSLTTALGGDDTTTDGQFFLGSPDAGGDEPVFRHPQHFGAGEEVFDVPAEPPAGAQGGSGTRRSAVDRTAGDADTEDGDVIAGVPLSGAGGGPSRPAPDVEIDVLVPVPQASTQERFDADGEPQPRESALRAPAGPRVVKSANLEIEVGEGGLDRAHRGALEAVERSGGFVQHSERTRGTLSLTARVPAERFERVLAEVGELGEVVSESVTGEDVSEELVDLEARLRHWRAQEAALLEVMDRARTVSESIQVRRELEPVQETIERLEGRRRALDDRVELSTLDVRLFEPDTRIPPRPDDGDDHWLAQAWERSRDLATGVMGGTLVALGAFVPVALLWGVPAFLVWSFVRRRYRAGGEPDDAGE